MHALAGDRMTEGKPGGVKAETVGFPAIEVVADNGKAKSFGVSAMNAQLVGSPRMGGERNEGAAFGIGAYYLVIGHGLFAMKMVCHLARTVQRIGAQGQGDSALALSLQMTVEQGGI